MLSFTVLLMVFGGPHSVRVEAFESLIGYFCCKFFFGSFLEFVCLSLIFVYPHILLEIYPLEQSFVVTGYFRKFIGCHLRLSMAWWISRASRLVELERQCAQRCERVSSGAVPSRFLCPGCQCMCLSNCINYLQAVCIYVLLCRCVVVLFYCPVKPLPVLQ